MRPRRILSPILADLGCAGKLPADDALAQTEESDVPYEKLHSPWLRATPVEMQRALALAAETLSAGIAPVAGDVALVPMLVYLYTCILAPTGIEIRAREERRWAC